MGYKELLEFVKNKNQINDEFNSIPQVSIRVDELPEGCEDKNRYANVVPFPETRVHLKRLSEDDEKSEYINANYIKGPKDAFSYIATQAPLENTCGDFWRMIWEQNSKVIVCLTDLTENGVERCAEYIPPSTIIDNNRTFGDFQVTLKSREVKEKYAVSTIHLRNANTQTWREIIHFWYDWPENGSPSDVNGVIGMLLEVRACVRSSLPEKLDENSNTETIEKADKVSTLDKTKSLQRTQGWVTFLAGKIL
jgi:protein tyrosine phosphatase